ncbi:Ankyrin repeat domain-containing protein [Nymphaea thermarum]|nr:Ankyrin repeat domain-containing protein [Nymphaea thermarum]
MVVLCFSPPCTLIHLSAPCLPSPRHSLLWHLSSMPTSKANSPTNLSLRSSLLFKSKVQKLEVGKWEPPDDGDESEYEEEDEWTALSDSEEQPFVRSGETDTAQKEILERRQKEFMQEVELLLEPEEKAIIYNNESPDLTKISSPKWSPFHSLTSSNQIIFMDELLENGYDIDAVNKDGFTALHKAVMVKKEAVVMHLLRIGANPHVRDRDGATLLHYAVQVGSLKLVKLLLKYKVDVNLADDEGWTPLHLAIQSRCRDIAKVLLVNGADKTRRTKNGKTPLDLSLCFGKDFKSYELAKLLKLVPAGMDF